ncbi:glycoside hydrolase family 32 protein [Vibrio albus]|nr:sucrose-6-phosphate hydrolase [Vibrio albus]
MLDKLIAACGGKENIRRILRVEESVVFELVNSEKLTAEAEEWSFSSSLSQLSWHPDEPLTEQEWHRIGQVIESNQHKLISDILLPARSAFRPKWHHAPQQGLINDPNGFIFHQGEYHLFYGLDPLIPGDKNRYWVHYTSTDLVNWHEKPVALYPSDWFDCHGVYSGHAISTEKELVLFYTGNVRVGEDRDRMTTQCIATSTDGIHFTKSGPVIKELPPGVTPHCRDPKVVRNGDHWLMLLGAQKENPDGKLQGRLAMYRSDDLYNWSYVGLSGDKMGDFGYMWECPDLYQVDGQLISNFCPQGIPSESEFHNIPHHCGYAQATLDENDQLSLEGFKELDHGFDFYAPQTAAAADGRRLLIGWMGMPDEIDQPSLQDNWMHQLTCIRELHWKNGRLYQNPARELQAMRGDQHQVEFTGPVMKQVVDVASKSFELHTRFSWPETGAVTLRLMDNGKYYCDFILDADNQRILLDRSRTLPSDGELVREILWENGQDVELQVLADSSSLEIFINDGEYVLSARVFTPEDATNIQLISEQPYCWQPLTYWLLT